MRVVPKDTKLSAALVLPIEFTKNKYHHYSNMIVDGRKLRISIDTGFDGGLLITPQTASLLKDNSVQETSILTQGLAGQVIHQIGFRSISIENLLLKDVSVETEENEGMVSQWGMDGLIGTGLLRRFHIIMDFPGHQFWIRQERHSITTTPRSTIGLQYLPSGRALVVLHVMKNSPAEHHGWKKGDEICNINNVPAPDIMSNKRAKGWGSSPVGKVVYFTMCDGSKRILRAERFY